MFSHALAITVGLLQLIPSIHALPEDYLFRRQACNSDNCLRALNANMPRASDACSSYFLKAVSNCAGPVSTATATVTVTTPGSGGQVVWTTYTTTEHVATTTIPVSTGPLKKRQAACTSSTITPSAIPTWAGACSVSPRFSSACGCLNIPHRTTTVGGSGSGSTTTTTVTTTVAGPGGATTSTRTVTASATWTTTPNIPSFYLRTNVADPISFVNGSYVGPVAYGADRTTYDLRANGDVQHNYNRYYKWSMDQITPGNYRIIDTGMGGGNSGPAKCRLHDPVKADGRFTCYLPNDKEGEWNICDGVLHLADRVVSGCMPTRIFAERA